MTEGAKFSTALTNTGVNTTGIVVPPEIVAALGGGARPAVVVTVNDYVYRTTIGIMKGTSMLPFSAQHREGSGIAGGDRIQVELRLDAEPRTVEVPADLSEALAAETGLEAAFGKQAPSRRKADVDAVVSAKSAATRAKRIQAIVSKLSA